MTSRIAAPFSSSIASTRPPPIFGILRSKAVIEPGSLVPRQLARAVATCQRLGARLGPLPCPGPWIALPLGRPKPVLPNEPHPTPFGLLRNHSIHSRTPCRRPTGMALMGVGTRCILLVAGELMITLLSDASQPPRNRGVRPLGPGVGAGRR